ncbi:10576_t:CDS:2 [Funneliformis geosporum]|uniref:10576_t:CDS:1 n=1 Tax=Funneliformis geosporum TaxID=1117311 RepID=A0A9W4SXX5_9GLOM|nr:10576_t:CDS:2 [Funneliformis geosporum]
MTTGIMSLEDIIDDIKKNIKTVFQNGIRAEDWQEVYIIGLQLTLDRLTLLKVNIIHIRNMAKKSRNNRRKTAAKYEHTYDRATGFIIVTNKKQNRIISVFDYPELNEYLGV